METRPGYRVITAIAAGILLCSSTVFAQANPGMNRAAAAGRFGSLPLSFEANQGQADSEVRFLSRGAGYSLFLTDSGAVLALGESSAAAESTGLFAGRPRVEKLDSQPSAGLATIRMELIGASRDMRSEAANPLPGVVSYFIGNDPGKWRTNIPTYARVKYESVYPGVDLVYYGNQGRLEYDFVVAPRADAEAIRFGLSGANHLRLDREGNLRIEGPNGLLQIRKPVVYQEEDGVRRRIEGHFRRIGDAIGFQLGRYNRALPLTIDPVLVYSTYLGGSAESFTNSNLGDAGTAIAVDVSGNAYVTGTAVSTDFPVTKGAFQTTNNGGACTPGPWWGTAFVSKLNAAGTALIYSTFVGGSGFGHAQGIAIDSVGDAYIAGYTDSSDFPVTTNAAQPKTHAGSSSDYTGFVTKLNATGTALVYSTYLGGSGGPAYAGGDGCNYGGDSAGAIAVDNSGNAYVASTVESKDFPVTTNAYQLVNRTTASDGLTGAVTKVNPSGTAFVYSTYLGGSGSAYNDPPLGDQANSIAVDGSGNAYITGTTSSADFPVTKGAYEIAAKGQIPATRSAV